MFEVDVSVRPDYGLISFIFATACSITLGHFVLHFHRRAAALDALPDDQRSAAVASIVDARTTSRFKMVPSRKKENLIPNESLSDHKFLSNSEAGYVSCTVNLFANVLFHVAIIHQIMTVFVLCSHNPR